LEKGREVGKVSLGGDSENATDTFTYLYQKLKRLLPPLGVQMFVYSKEKCSDFITSLHKDLREARQEMSDAKEWLAWSHGFLNSVENKKRNQAAENILSKRLKGNHVSDGDMEFSHIVLRNRQRISEETERSLAVIEKNEKRESVLEEALRQMTITLQLLNTIYDK
jgi:hypothetical protein